MELSVGATGGRPALWWLYNVHRQGKKKARRSGLFDKASG